MSDADKELAAAGFATCDDAAAFDIIARRHREDLLRRARYRLSNREAAEDCVGEALLRAWVSLARFRGRCNLHTWLVRILEKVCLEEQHRQARQAHERLPEELASSAEVGAAAMTRRDLVCALKGMARLPLGLRVTALLNLVEGLSGTEVASVLGISEEAAKMRLSRARALMSLLSASPDGARNARRYLAEGYHFIAVLLLRNGRQVQSDRALLRALQIDVETADRIWLRQQLARGTPQQAAVYEQAIRVGRQASEIWPHDPVVQLTRGNLEFWQCGDYQTAEGLWSAAASTQSNAGKIARLHLAGLYYSTGRLREALALVSPLVGKYPRWGYAVELQGQVLAALGAPGARAWVDRGRALAMVPVGAPRSDRKAWVDAGNLRYAVAEALANLGQWGQAERCLRAGDRAYPTDYPRPTPEQVLWDLRHGRPHAWQPAQPSR